MCDVVDVLVLLLGLCDGGLVVVGCGVDCCCVVVG